LNILLLRVAAAAADIMLAVAAAQAAIALQLATQLRQDRQLP
jgi:hypothetical protein